MKRILWVCLSFFALFVGWAVFVGADFYVIPVREKFTSWDKKISGAARFTLILDGAAALDRETGLVWEKSPDATMKTWYDACNHCYTREVGSRKGWRLPAIEELASLVDTSQASPTLPAGHPFTDVQSYHYWSSSTVATDASRAWVVTFGNGNVHIGNGKSFNYYVWCVRGGYGHDAY